MSATMASEFPLFNLLPGEIRLKIWAFAISVPRTLTVTTKRPNYKRGVIQPKQTFQSNLPIPATLCACAESRHEALAVYKPYFASYQTTDGVSVSTGRYLYASLEQDTIRCEDSLLAYLVEPELLKGTKTMILDVKDSGYFGHFNGEILKNMTALRNLDLWGHRSIAYAWK